MKLKLIILTLFSTFFLSCQPESPEPEKAAAFVENYIRKTGGGDYSDLSSYYSEEMKNGETDEQRIAKLKQIKEALGDVVNIKLTETKEDVYGENPAITLVFAVKHDLMTVTETFTVIEENDKLKIARQNIVSVK
jgi:hypothetical protein